MARFSLGAGRVDPDTIATPGVGTNTIGGLAPGIISIPLCNSSAASWGELGRASRIFADHDFEASLAGWRVFRLGPDQITLPVVERLAGILRHGSARDS